MVCLGKYPYSSRIVLGLQVLTCFRTSWDGVEGRLEDKELEDGTIVRKNPDMGYCPHFQILFGTWHRPYLVLFEVSGHPL